MAEKYLVGLLLHGGLLRRSNGLFVAAILFCVSEQPLPDDDAIGLLLAGGRSCAILLINGIIAAAATTVLAQKRRGCSTC